MSIVDLDKEIGIDLVVHRGVCFDVVDNCFVFFFARIGICFRVIRDVKRFPIAAFAVPLGKNQFVCETVSNTIGIDCDFAKMVERVELLDAGRLLR